MHRPVFQLQGDTTVRGRVSRRRWTRRPPPGSWRRTGAPLGFWIDPRAIGRGGWGGGVEGPGGTGVGWGGMGGWGDGMGGWGVCVWLFWSHIPFMLWFLEGKLNGQRPVWWLQPGRRHPGRKENDDMDGNTIFPLKHASTTATASRNTNTNTNANTYVYTHTDRLIFGRLGTLLGKGLH